MKIIDMHCDTIKECFLRKENLRNNYLCVDLEKMKKNNGAAQFFAVWLSMPKNRTERAEEEKSLYEQGMEVIQIMAEMAGSEAYAGMVSGSGEIQARMGEIGGGTYEDPEAVYQITLDPGSFETVLGMAGMEGMPETVETYLEQKMPATLISQINGMGGVEELAAANACAAGKTFVSQEEETDCIYLYTFSQGTPAAVAFTSGDGGAVSANGFFILYDGFSCGSEEEIQAYFDSTGIGTEVVQLSVQP